MWLGKHREHHGAANQGSHYKARPPLEEEDRAADPGRVGVPIPAHAGKLKRVGSAPRTMCYLFGPPRGPYNEGVRMTPQKKFIIIGAGPTGRGAAYRLKELGCNDFTV